jgi:hypothetical protein
MTVAETALTAFEINLFGLAEALNKQVSDPLVAIWRRKFEHLPDELFGRAVALAVDECTFFPSPAEFGRFVEAALSPEDRALLAGMRALRGWLSAGMVPANWDVPRLRRTRQALGLPPSRADERYLDDERRRCGLAGDDADHAALPGTIAGYLAGERRDGGALLALVGGVAG